MLSKNRDIYNHLAQTYESRQENSATKILRKKEVGLIKKFAYGEILDLGCGTGFHLGILGNPIGLDVSEKMLYLARNKNRPLIQGDIGNLPFKDGCAHTVYCFYGTLNLVGLDCVREISRITKTGGRALISVTSVKDIDGHRSSTDKKIKKFRIEGKSINMRLFDKDEVVDAFEKSGFRLKRFDSLFCIQKPRWGNFQKFSFLERLKLKIDRLLPKNWGRIYLFVFEK